MGSSSAFWHLISFRIGFISMSSEVQQVGNLIRSCSIFRTFSDEELEQVRDCANQIILEAGDVLYQRGERSTSFYLVKKGEIIVKQPAKRIPEPTANILEGQLFGALSALGQYPRAGTALASDGSDTELIQIDSEALTSKMKDGSVDAVKLFENLLYRASERLETSSQMMNFLMDT